MTVVFSTYQSIQVVADMQAATRHTFYLVVCDEAHRTAGVASVKGEDSPLRWCTTTPSSLRRSGST